MYEDMPKDMTEVCMVGKTRRAARAVTRRYNRLLEPFGLKTTQASLIFVIRWSQHDSISEMAAQLGIERSALTRNLKILRDMGLVTRNSEGRGKAQRPELTEEGLKMLKTVIPLWQKAQNDLKEELGEDSWNEIQRSLSRMGKVG